MRNEDSRNQSAPLAKSSYLPSKIENEGLSDDVRAFVSASRSEATIRSYRTSWRLFEDFCKERDLTALPAPPATVAQYVAALAVTHRPTTIGKILAAISVAHRAAAFESPCKSELVRSTVKGVRRTVGVAKRKVAPLRITHVRSAMESMRTDIKGLRDRALVLWLYAGAFRRSELVSLTFNDLRWDSEGVVVTIRRSKTDQEGAGQTVAIMKGEREATCPVRALKTWLDTAAITEGPIFRPIAKGGKVLDQHLTGCAVALIVKSIAPLVGLDPAQTSGHSGRAGLITDAFAISGLGQAEIAKHSRHRSNVISEYLREADHFRRNPSGKVGL